MMKLDQMSLVSAMLMEASRQFKEVGEPDNCESYQMNAIIEGANVAVKGFNREKVEVRAGEGLLKWLASDDTGMSSKFMSHVIAGAPEQRHAYILTTRMILADATGSWKPFPAHARNSI
jgi:hypothetical protein